MNETNLIAKHNDMDCKKAKGINGVNKDEYDQDLYANISNIVLRLKRDSYSLQPSRRTYILKLNDKKRPLGISCYEDKRDGGQRWAII